MQNRFEAFRSRSAIQMVGESAALLVRQAGSLLSSVGLLAGPVLFISALAFGWFFEPFVHIEETEELMKALAGAAGRPAYFMVLLTAWFAQFVLFGGIAVWVVLLVETDEPPGPGLVWDRLVREFGLLLRTGLGVFILLLALTSLLLFPVLGGLLFLLALAYYAVVLSPLAMVRLWERLGLLRAFFRCRVLVRHGFGATLGALFLSAVLYLAGAVVLGILLPVVQGILPHSGIWTDFAGALFSTLGMLWFSVVLLVANVNYFNLIARERLAGDAHDSRRAVDNDGATSLGSP